MPKPHSFDFFRRHRATKLRWGYKIVEPLFNRDTIHTIYLGRYAISWVTTAPRVQPAAK